MATNRKYKDPLALRVEVAEGTESGDAVLIGDIPGVALTDADSDDIATVQLGKGAFEVPVKNTSDSVDAGVGDPVYWNTDDDTLDADKPSNGVLYGHLLAGVVKQTSTAANTLVLLAPFGIRHTDQT